MLQFVPLGSEEQAPESGLRFVPLGAEPNVVPPEVQAERNREAAAIIEAERQANLKAGFTDVAEANAREIARLQGKPVEAKAAPTLQFVPLSEPAAEEKPGFFGRLKQSFVDVGIPQAIAGFTGLNVTAQGSQIAKTADKLKALEAAGQGESKEAQGLRTTLDFYTKRQGTYFKDLAEKQAELSKAPVYAGVKKLSEAKTFSEGFKTFAEDPVNIVANLTAQSLPSAVPGLVLGVINPTLGAAAMGGSSFGVEFGGSLLEFARDKGVDTTDPKQVAAFFENKELLKEGVDKAGLRAGIIGAGDLLLAGLASKTLVPKRITGKAAKNITNVGAQMGAQAVGGGGFEAAAQVATEGEVTKPGEVLAETFGGFGTAPLDVYAQTRAAAREAAKAAEETEAPAPPPTEPERIEPTMGSPLGTRTKEITTLLTELGLPPEESQTIAERRAAEEFQATSDRLGETVPTTPQGRLEERTQEFIAAGYSPQQAAMLAEDSIAAEDEADATAQATTETTEDAARLVAGPDGAGVSVAEQRGAGLPTAEGTAAVERDGVVPAGPAATEAIAGERTEPAAVTTPVEGETVGTQAPQAVEAEAQRTEAPAAPAANQLVIQNVFSLPGTFDYESEVLAPALQALADNNAIPIKLKDGTDIDLVVARNAEDDTGRVIAFDKTGNEVGQVVFNKTEENGIRFNPHVYVEENFQRKGLATALYDTAEAYGAKIPSLEQEGQVRTEEGQAFRLARDRKRAAATAPATETPAATAPTIEAPAAPAAPTAKRGRPALSPEARAEAEARRKAAKNTSRKADSLVTKMNALLDAQLNPDNFETDEAFQEAQSELNNRRAAAIREVLMIEPDVRGSAAGKRVKEALARPEITPKQLADIKKGVELARKGVSRSEAGAAAAPNDAFKSSTNGVQSLGTILKGKAPAALKAIAQRLRGANAGVKFQVIEKDDPLPPVLQKYQADWDAARGLFIQNDATGERAIYVKGSSFGEDQGANDITVLHENLHAATNQKLYLGLKAIQRGFSRNSQLVRATQDLVSLMRRVGDEMVRLDKRGQLPEAVGRLYEATGGKLVADPREFLAYGMSDPDFQQFLMSVRGAEAETSFFTRFVDTVRRLLGMGEEDTNALTDLIVATDKIISARKTPTMLFLERADRKLAQKSEQAEKVSAAKKQPPKPAEERTQKEIDKDVAEARERVRISTEGEPSSVAKRLLKARDVGTALDALKDAWNFMSAKQREATVRLPTMDFLVEWMGKDIPRLKEVNTYVKDMTGMATTFLEGNAQLLKAMQRAFKQDPELQKKLSDLVYTSTLARIDPANPNAKTRNAGLDADYKALGASGQAMYKMLRDYYKGVHELYRLLLDQQVQNLSGVTQETKDNILAKIRQAYEQGEAIDPYFPLVRRGDYWLSVGSGKNRQFYMFESQLERDAKARELAAERRTSLEELLDEKKFDIGNNVGSLRRASVGKETSGVLTAVFDQIDQQNFSDPNAREALKDAVYQIYLQTMPEQSFRNMFVHRKGLAGFSTDLLRNTASTASRMSMQLARLKYAPLIRNSLSAARESIAGRPELLPFVDEIERRATLALSPQEGGLSQAVAGVANKASYIWYLSSASSALIQPFSILISGVPVLAANHSNSLGAAAEIAKAIGQVNQYGIAKKNIDGTVSYTAPTLANNTSLPADERRAIKEMTRRGVQQSTYSSLVFEYKNNASAELESLPSKGAELGRMLVGGLMHNTERLTREALYIASYRLGRKQGMTFEQAVDQAVADVNEALADYDITNRPRWMQQGLGRIAFQFKMYPLHMMLLMATNFKRMLPLLNKEGKAAAAKKFFGIVGATGMLAGVSGLPMFSAMMGVASWAMKQMADDDELPEEFKDKDLETWFRTVFLAEKLGDMSIGDVPVSEIADRGVLNAITGVDIASRIGLNDLWFRDGKEMRTARESAIAFAIDTFGGPTASLILQMVDAYEAYMYGDYQKALEKASPSAVRNLLVANRYAEEGIKTSRGAEIIPKDDVRAGELWAQRIGFRPDVVAKIQQNNFKMTAAEQRVVFERDSLMKKLNIAFAQREKTGDDSRFQKLVQEEVTKFNRKNPENAIEYEDIYNSLTKQVEARKSARAGFNVDEKNFRVMREIIEANEAAVERRK